MLPSLFRLRCAIGLSLIVHLLLAIWVVYLPQGGIQLQPSSGVTLQLAMQRKDASDSAIAMSAAITAPAALAPETQRSTTAMPEVPKNPAAGAAVDAFGETSREPPAESQPTRSATEILAPTNADDSSQTPTPQVTGPSSKPLNAPTEQAIEVIAQESPSTAASQSEDFIAAQPLRATTNQEGSIIRYQAATFRGPPPLVIKPALAKKKRLSGNAIVRGYVTAEGELINAFIYQSSGHEVLDIAALSQAKNWPYEPAREARQPVGGWVEIPIIFR